MSILKSAIVGAALMLGAGAAAVAAQTNTPKTASTKAEAAAHEEMGTVTSMSDSRLVLSHTVNGKQEETTFKLDANTKKIGVIDKGAHVSVSYRDENHERIATEVKAEPKKS